MRWLRRRAHGLYRRLLEREVTETPTHVAVIQDGNRRYARKRGDGPTDGHRAGAETTEAVLKWCRDLGVEELTLYAFSTENFNRPSDERRALFDLLERKLRNFADSDEVQKEDVRIRAIGDVARLPGRVCDAIDYAETQTADHDRFVLNVALAYGGRTELLGAARQIATEAATGDLDPDTIDVGTVEERLYGHDRHLRDVDLIVRTGGDERTSNFLPWHANGNEAAVFFCAPYWPEFSKTDFLRGIRTWESREQSWRRTRARRALALLGALGEDRGLTDVDLPEARAVLRRFRDSLPSGERPDPGEYDEAETDGRLAD